MPVISSATIRGTIVILSALSQSSPIGSIQGSEAVPAAGDTSSTPKPRSIPAISAERMSQAEFKTIGLASWMERVCQDGELAGGGVCLNTKRSYETATAKQ